MDTNNKGSNKEPETKNNTPANGNVGNAASNGNNGNGNSGNGNSGANPGNGNAGNPGNGGGAPGNSGAGNGNSDNGGNAPGNGNSGPGNSGGGGASNGNPGGGDNGNGNGGPKDITIIVNGTPHVVAKEEMTFREIIVLAELASGPNVSYTLTYRRGHGNKPEGSLVEGDVVKVKDGMIFNATATDKS